MTHTDQRHIAEVKVEKFMSMAGAIAIWNDVESQSIANFRAWHSREHAPERVGIPGFLRARRYRSILDNAPNRFFMLYEADSTNVLDSVEYTHRLNNPTSWTRQMSPVFSNSSRALCKVEFSRGIGQGALITTLAYDLPSEQAPQHYHWLAHTILPALADEPGVAGVHLCRTDMSKSTSVSKEKQGRKISAPNWVLLIEGDGQPSDLTSATAELVRGLDSIGVPGTLDMGQFTLEYALGKSTI